MYVSNNKSAKKTSVDTCEVILNMIQHSGHIGIFKEECFREVVLLVLQSFTHLSFLSEAELTEAAVIRIILLVISQTRDNCEVGE